MKEIFVIKILRDKMGFGNDFFHSVFVYMVDGRRFYYII